MRDSVFFSSFITGKRAIEISAAASAMLVIMKHKDTVYRMEAIATSTSNTMIKPLVRVSMAAINMLSKLNFITNAFLFNMRICECFDRIISPFVDANSSLSRVRNLSMMPSKRL